MLNLQWGIYTGYDESLVEEFNRKYIIRLNPAVRAKPQSSTLAVCSQQPAPAHQISRLSSFHAGL